MSEQIPVSGTRPERFWIDGVETDGLIPVTDSSVLRGDGCFEVMRAYGGRIFALGDHLDRLGESAKLLQIPLPARSDLATWVGLAADAVPNGAVRVVVTRGDALPGVDPETRVVVFAHPWQRGRDTVRLGEVEAPWHSAGRSWALTGAKVLSYAPNLSATRTAEAEGFDDALLLSTDEIVLEGPTFSVGWVVDEVLETPTLDLGILDSITRRHVLGCAREIGVTIEEGTWHVDRLDEADEVFAVSTIRQVQAVVAVGDRTFEPGPVTAMLADAFTQLVGSEPS